MARRDIARTSEQLIQANRTKAASEETIENLRQGTNDNTAMTTMPVLLERAGTENLQSLGVAGLSTQLWLASPGQKPDKAPTSVSLSDQELVQVLEASVTGLEPGKLYVLALPNEDSGGGALQPLQGFVTNPAGAAVVNSIGPIR